MEDGRITGRNMLTRLLIAYLLPTNALNINFIYFKIFKKVKH
jgi:hypothetical protein